MVLIVCTEAVEFGLAGGMCVWGIQSRHNAVDVSLSLQFPDILTPFQIYTISRKIMRKQNKNQRTEALYSSTSEDKNK